MKSSVYPINKNINKPIEFRGLQAQYIVYFAGVLLALLILFSVLYIVGVNTYICLMVILSTGLFFTKKIFHWSNKYGTHGMMKMLAKTKMPKEIKSYTRSVFYLKNQDSYGI
ncbi:hypothetical protein A5893_02125 [Pedobacter psychrophilus]|uniref:Conjugal transfer protein TraF n=1 Tax=Pedobacter psychrophilus TaxID=1826909 RepID=A0A179DLE2_9SPHI|nr:DUF4133 domain-containing protein [Pedobacter psychrophilus]OAQ41936.1 hypothetical protein A5893_02125 [Pedobacter psychrophilus]